MRTPAASASTGVGKGGGPWAGYANSRLKELRAAGLVDHDGGGYRLSKMGVSLTPLILQLHAWADDWGARLAAVPRRKG